MKLRALILVAAISLSACGDGQYHVEDDPYVGPNGEIEYIGGRAIERINVDSTDDRVLQGVEAWNQALGPSFTGFDVFTTAGLRLEVHFLPHDQLHEICMNDHAMGCQDDIVGPGRSCKLYISEKAKPRTLLHEIGHCLGFGHSRNEDSVMWGRSNGGEQITDEMVDVYWDTVAAQH